MVLPIHWRIERLSAHSALPHLGTYYKLYSLVSYALRMTFSVIGIELYNVFLCATGCFCCTTLFLVTENGDSLLSTD